MMMTLPSCRWFMPQNDNSNASSPQLPDISTVTSFVSNNDDHRTASLICSCYSCCSVSVMPQQQSSQYQSTPINYDSSAPVTNHRNMSTSGTGGGLRVPLMVHHRTRANATAAAAADDDNKVPLFLMKLWNIVDDANYATIIAWDESGYSFHIIDPYTFCKNVLPQYFKHNNLNSLIRQLNMYGFRKITPIERSGLTRSDSDHEHLEFSHPFFVRDHPELLNNIKRKTAASSQSRVPGGTIGNSTGPTGIVSQQTKEFSRVIDELRQLRDKQATMDSKMTSLVKENQSMWQEVSRVRAQHMKQQQIVNKLVQFLVALVQPTQPKRIGKRNFLAIGAEDGAGGKRSKSSTSGSSVSDLLERLQRELIDHTDPTGVQQQQHGPIIADVTDDIDQQQQQHVPSPITSSSSAFDRARQYHWPNQIIGDNVTLSSRGDPLMTESPSPSISPSFDLTSLMAGSSNGDLFRPRSQTPSSVLINNPQIERQISQEFTDYLSGIDTGIDNCRDLLSNGALPLDADTLREFFCDADGSALVSATPYIVITQLDKFQAEDEAAAAANQLSVYQQRPPLMLTDVDDTEDDSEQLATDYLVDSPHFSVHEPLTPAVSTELHTPVASPQLQYPGAGRLVPNASSSHPLSAVKLELHDMTGGKGRSMKGKRK